MEEESAKCEAKAGGGGGGGGGPRREEKGDDVKKRKLLWDKVSRSDASGPRIVSVKQRDTNKGTEENPDMHC